MLKVCSSSGFADRVYLVRLPESQQKCRHINELQPSHCASLTATNCQVDHIEHDKSSKCTTTKQQRLATSIPNVLQPYVTLSIKEMQSLRWEQDDRVAHDLQMAATLSTLVSVLVDHCSEQAAPNQQVLDEMLNPDMVDLMQHALQSTMAGGVPFTETRDNETDSPPQPTDTSLKVRNSLRKLQKFQTGQQPQPEMLGNVSDRRSTAIDLAINIESSSSVPHIYFCQFCAASFARRASYVRHRRMHLTPEPFECRVCHKRFASACRRKSHMAASHDMHH